MERHGARFLFFIIIGVFFHDLCLCFCFGWIEGSEGPWSDGDFMQRPNDLGQGVHSDSALGDANIIQVTAVSIRITTIISVRSRGVQVDGSCAPALFQITVLPRVW